LWCSFSTFVPESADRTIFSEIQCIYDMPRPNRPEGAPKRTRSERPPTGGAREGASRKSRPAKTSFGNEKDDAPRKPRPAVSPYGNDKDVTPRKPRPDKSTYGNDRDAAPRKPRPSVSPYGNDRDVTPRKPRPSVSPYGNDKDVTPRKPRPERSSNGGEREEKPRIYTAKDAPTYRKKSDSDASKPNTRRGADNATEKPWVKKSSESSDDYASSRRGDDKSEKPRSRMTRATRTADAPKYASKYADDPTRDRNKYAAKTAEKPKYRAGDGPQKSKLFGEEYIAKPRLKDDKKGGGKKTGDTGAGAPVAFGPKKYINVYLSIGSNMGKRKENMIKAVTEIHKTIGKVARQSKIYETQPWGKRDQNSFLNQVIMINTISSPKDVLAEIGKIEKEMGRDRKEKNGPRTIDIDILIYGKRIVKDKNLEIPHPEMQNRAFVLVPFMEIAPQLMHPVLQKPIDELYINCEDLSDVILLEEQ
jgi:2-amino-4-hydroxy-6-hydroxymethyldihydropteridine diphosphokinase